ncbi:hypothetical protein CC1G_05002 [Coprinopsis cinerea okayama7|uniref:Uncharacterized protein n=1 Tax=Coprinopsis cinerea (strain Okayama-7 / 130 / ATCC MYA-4618 / FGSC 9003) TaxID=240176 RepID=A8NSG9_COPC7|nr:hypothetical protein CC1G_05002 [Coprinopsis cinerea okayama7\|eukprot:XP_001836009.2 hypothetical protein CC1G_05002 [Coprinopsis cinerea okayama7\
MASVCPTLGSRSKTNTNRNTVHEHPHIVSLLSLSIFFGPIIVLIPFVLLQEIGVLIAFYLGFFTHGLFPRGRIEDRYEALKEGCMESKEKVFASVEAVTATFNEWTTEYPVLMIFRVYGHDAAISTPLSPHQD